MAIVFGEGFETFAIGDTMDDLDNLYNASFDRMSNDHDIVSSSRSPGEQALFLRNINIIGTPAYLQIPLAQRTSASTLIVGVAIKSDSGYGSKPQWPLVQWEDTDGEMLTLASTSSGALELLRGTWTALGFSGTTVDSWAGPLPVGSWFYLEWKTTFHETTGSYEVRVAESGIGSETTVMSGSGVNTTNTGGTRAYELQFGMSQNSEDRQLDDIVVIDDQSGATGNEATDFIGEIRVQRVRPNGVGDNSGFDTSAAVDNYTLVDEDDQDADTTYVESNTASTKDLYHYENADGLTSQIFGVLARPVLRKSDGGIHTYRLLTKSNGTEDQTDTRYPGNTFMRQSYVWETDPDTSDQWTLTAFNNAQFGIEVVS